MIKRTYFILILIFPIITLASSTDFSYDKSELSQEFSALNEVSTYVDETHISYTELTESHIFEGELELNNSINVQPNLKFGDVHWGSFAWGFCCFPVGIFTVLINDDKDQNSKNSFWAGVGTASIAVPIAYIALNIFIFFSFGGGF